MKELVFKAKQKDPTLCSRLSCCVQQQCALSFKHDLQLDYWQYPNHVRFNSTFKGGPIPIRAPENTLLTHSCPPVPADAQPPETHTIAKQHRSKHLPHFLNEPATMYTYVHTCHHTISIVMIEILLQYIQQH